MALHLPIVGQCNIKCVFCSAWGRGGSFDMDYLKREVDQDMTGHIQISGGDPLMKDPVELLEILKHCRLRGKIIEFQTNATTIGEISDRMFVALLKLVDFFNVNFSAHTQELDYEVTGIRSAFERRCRGVDRLIAAGAQVRFTYIVHGANVRHCEEFVRFCGERFPELSWIQFSYVKGMGRAKGDRTVMPRYQVAAPHLNAAMRACRKLDIEFEVDHIPVCFVPEFKDHHVDYQKMLKTQPGVHLSEKQAVAECDGCSLKPHCPGPRVDYIELYKGLTA